MLKLRQKQFTILGDIDGFDVRYNTTTSVTITSGFCEANGKFFTQASDVSHSMTSLASIIDFHYIYIDDSASTEPTAVIIDSTTEPTFSTSKRGWYNGDDRMIGLVLGTDAVPNVAYFDVEVLGDKTIKNKIAQSLFPQMASVMAPTGLWQTPDDNEASVVTPVNATLIFVRMNNSDIGSTGHFHVASNEEAAVITVPDNSSSYTIYSESARLETFAILGASRNIKIAAANDDDNFLSAWCTGFDYAR